MDLIKEELRIETNIFINGNGDHNSISSTRKKQGYEHFDPHSWDLKFKKQKGNKSIILKHRENRYGLFESYEVILYGFPEIEVLPFVNEYFRKNVYNVYEWLRKDDKVLFHIRIERSKPYYTFEVSPLIDNYTRLRTKNV